MIIAKLIDTFAWLIVYPHNHPHITSNECLAHNYIGTYGSYDVFIPPESCLRSFVSTDDSPSVYIYPGNDLVWVEQAALEPRLLTDYPFSLPSLQKYLAALPETDPTASDFHARGQQALLGPIDNHPLHHTPNSALLALSPTHTRELSLALPPTCRMYMLPSTPYPFAAVPEPAKARVRDILKTLRFNPEVARIASNISLPQGRN